MQNPLSSVSFKKKNQTSRLMTTFIKAIHYILSNNKYRFLAYVIQIGLWG